MSEGSTRPAAAETKAGAYKHLMTGVWFKVPHGSLFLPPIPNAVTILPGVLIALVRAPW